MDERPTFRNFARAFFGNWLAWMSGGPSVPVALVGFYLENTIARIAFWIIAAGCLILSGYQLWKPERTKAIELQRQLARISEDRPLSFTGLSLGRYIQPRPPYGDWLIERIELGFENTGAQRLRWTIKDFFYEDRGIRTAIPLPAGAGKYSLPPREAMDYGFDVPGLQIQLQALRVPTTIRFGFTVEYDNIPPLNVRHMKRLIESNIRTLRPADYDCDWNVIEQDES
jgi:hypothetical protein